MLRGVVLGLIVVLAAYFAGYLLGVQLPGLAGPAKDEKAKDPPPALGVSLVKGKPHTLEVPEDVRSVLGFRQGKEDLLAAAQAPTVMRPLVLSGSTALDPTRLARIRARFAPARVVEIGQVADFSHRTAETTFREFGPGDRVREGDVLGVFYSADVGSKKNDLLNALVQLELDQKLYDEWEKHRGAVTEAQLLTQFRAVQGDRNEINRALNTLKVWDIPQKEIDALRAEAKKLSDNKDAWFKTTEGRWVKGEKQSGAGKSERGKIEGGKIEEENPWGRVTLRAPFEGVIIERTVHVGEMVVDGTVNLFQIADVSRLLVKADAPEDDLPTLEDLKRNTATLWWSARTVGAAATPARFKLTDQSVTVLRALEVPAEILVKLHPLREKEFAAADGFVAALTKVLSKDELRRFQNLVLELADTSALLGPIEEIGYLIDPNQHTAVIKGYVANPGQRLRAGQYVSATIYVPPPKGVVEIPVNALVDDGRQSIVFVQTDASKHQYTMRRVQVTHRFDQRVFVRSTSIPKEEQLTAQEAEEGLLPREPLLPDDRVIQSGVGELKTALLDLESQPQKQSKED